jgi:predicted RNA-binding protein with PUA-like domain
VKRSEAEPAGWLFKEEPEHYSFSELEKDGATWGDGVENNLARQNLRKISPGDRVLYYHTGKERAIVGDMRVVEGPVPDPNSDAKSVMVKVQAGRRWSKPVTLEEIKKDPALAGWDLIRLPRLSVVPVTRQQWSRLEQLRDEAN